MAAQAAVRVPSNPEFTLVHRPGTRGEREGQHAKQGLLLEERRPEVPKARSQTAVMAAGKLDDSPPLVQQKKRREKMEGKKESRVGHGWGSAARYVPGLPCFVPGVFGSDHKS